MIIGLKHRMKGQAKIRAIWIGLPIPASADHPYAKEADVSVVGVRVVFMVAAAAYALFIWLRDLGRGETDNGIYQDRVLTEG